VNVCGNVSENVCGNVSENVCENVRVCWDVCGYACHLQEKTLIDLFM